MRALFVFVQKGVNAKQHSSMTYIMFGGKALLFNMHYRLMANNKHPDNRPNTKIDFFDIPQINSLTRN